MRRLHRRLKKVCQLVLPPFLWAGLRWFRRQSGVLGPREWEYAPDGWGRTGTGSVKGWNVKAVAEAESARWNDYVASLTGSGPLGSTSGATPSEDWHFSNHNLWISHAYVLALAAAGRDQVSILDWGGSLGQFYLGARTALPGVQIRYEVKDVPVLCAYGRRLQPDVVFHVDDSCLERNYDLVLASGSLQYSVDWRQDLGKLARSAAPYLYVTRLPVLFKRPSFVALQRAYRYGYGTEFLGWFFNRRELLESASQANLVLLREFLIERHPRVSGAPEQAEARGYLFRTDGA
jgi:putative methyltransferase (TIGR04325 family)